MIYFYLQYLLQSVEIKSWILEIFLFNIFLDNCFQNDIVITLIQINLNYLQYKNKILIVWKFSFKWKDWSWSLKWDNQNRLQWTLENRFISNKSLPIHLNLNKDENGFRTVEGESFHAFSSDMIKWKMMFPSRQFSLVIKSKKKSSILCNLIPQR